MGYVTMLLEQVEPLEPHEVGALQGWLAVLKADCEMFGPTAEDEARMSRIATRIKTESARLGLPVPAELGQGRDEHG